MQTTAFLRHTAFGTSNKRKSSSETISSDERKKRKISQNISESESTSRASYSSSSDLSLEPELISSFLDDISEGEKQKVIKIEPLGFGSHGTVWLCDFYKNETSKKEIALKELINHEKGKKVEVFKREKEVMKLISKEFELSPDDAAKSTIIEFLNINTFDYQFAMEYLPVGSLYDCIRKNNGYLFDYIKIQILKDTAIALDFLNKLEILHLDVKSKNILLTENGHAKLADFGLARLAKSAPIGYIGTIGWMAPEIGISKPTSQADVYSLGMVAWYLAAETSPYLCYLKNTPEEKLLLQKEIQNGLREYTPTTCGPLYSELINWCWNEEPTDRPTAYEVVEKLESDKITSLVM